MININAMQIYINLKSNTLLRINNKKNYLYNNLNLSNLFK